MMLIQIVVEIIAEALPWDWPLFSQAKNGASTLGCFGGLLVGALLGGLSLQVFPRAFIPFGWMRIGNLVFAPCLSAFLSMLIARWKENDNEETGFHMVRSFCFTMALVAVRFAYMQR